MKKLSPMATIEKINESLYATENFQKSIDKENIEHANKIAKLRSEIDTLDEKISKTQKTVVNAELSDILTRLAVSWHTTRSNLRVNYSTTLDFETYDFSVEEFNNMISDIKQTLPTITSAIPVTFVVDAPNQKNKKVLLPTVEIPLESVQLDGKKLFDHIKPSFSIPRIGKGRVEIKFDNINCLVLPFALTKLCGFTEDNHYKAKTPVTQVILDSAQNYYAKSKNFKTLE